MQSIDVAYKGVHAATLRTEEFHARWIYRRLIYDDNDDDDIIIVLYSGSERKIGHF